MLGVDFGSKRIGLAVMDTSTGLPRPLQPIQASGTLLKDATKIVEISRMEQAETIVVGLPLDSDGETKMSRICRMLGGHIAALGLEVVFVDEALTSIASENEMRLMGLTGAEIRKRVDSEAACRILERFKEPCGEEA